MKPERLSSPALWTILLLCAGAYFFPFLLRGEHAVSFNLERAGSTAIPGGALIPRTSGRFSRDNSPTVLHYPNACLAAQSLRTGHLPTWNPYQGCGAPALGGGQIFPFSPFLWPFFVHPTPWVFTLGLLLGSLFAGVGGFLWMGRFLRGWPLGLGAALWVFNPWTMRCIGFNNTWADWWLPWILWSWHLALERRGAAVALPAVFMAGAVYCGHPESAFLLAAAGALYAFALWLGSGKADRPALPRFAGTLALNTLLAIALTAIHWLPLLTTLRESLTYKASGAVGRTLYPTGALFNPSSDLYVGALPFVLAVVGFAALARQRELRPVLLLLGVGVLLAVQLPYLGFLQRLTSAGGSLPGLYARSLLWAGLAAAATLGVQVLSEDPPPERWGHLRLAALGLLAYAVFLWADYESGSMAWLMSRPGLIAWGCAGILLMIPVTLLKGKALRAAGFAGVSLFLLLEPLATQRFRYPAFSRLDPLEGGPPAVAQLRSLCEQSHSRFWAGPGANRERADLEPNLATLWRVRDVRMVSPLFLDRYVEVAGALAGKVDRTPDTWLLLEEVPPVRLGLLGVAHRAEVLDERTASFAWAAVPEGLPRARLVHEVLAAGGQEAAAAWFAREAGRYPEGALGSGVILEGWTGGADVGRAAADDAVEWIEDGLKEVRLRVRSASGGVLVLLDAFADDWKADVDGREAPIYKANLAFRAVAVPAGVHEIAYRFEPRSVRLGLGLTIATWVALCAWFAWPILPWRSRKAGAKP